MLREIQRAVADQAVQLGVVALHSDKGPGSIYSLRDNLNQAVKRKLGYEIVAHGGTASEIQAVGIGHLHCEENCLLLHIRLFIGKLVRIQPAYISVLRHNHGLAYIPGGK